MTSADSNPPLSATVVICTVGRAQELDGCLQAVAGLCYPQFEVLVVENGPQTTAIQAMAEQYGARYLNSPRIGLSRARNHAASACRTSLIAYLDDDARPHPNWLAALANEFADPTVMAAGGEVLPRSGQSQDELSPAVNPALRPRLVVDRETPNWFSYTNFGGIGDGCTMAFRRAAFELLWPGFDERLGRGALLDSAEEHFAYFQLVLRGYRCVHTPEAIVWHPTPQTATEWRRFHRANMTNAVAYAAMLWKEFPQTRELLVKHLRERNRAPRRRARAHSAMPQLSWTEKLQVIAGGLWIFLRLPKPAHSATPIACANACHCGGKQVGGTTPISSCAAR